MPRIRTLKPEHRAHRKVGPLSDRDYRLWVSLILEADDEGRLVVDTRQIRAVTWPYGSNISLSMVEASLSRLEALGLLMRYRVGAVEYACFPSWHDHQVINRMRPSSLPAPHGAFTEHSLNTHGAFTEHSRGNEGRKEGKGRKGRESGVDNSPAQPNGQGAMAAGENWTAKLTPAPALPERTDQEREQWADMIKAQAAEMKRKYSAAAAKTPIITTPVIETDEETPF